MLCKFDSCLTAECYYNTVWLFCIDDTHNIFCCKRLKVKSVGSVEVGRYGFRVVVYDNNIIACLFKCPYAVNRRIVKFDTLTDSDRA